MKFIKTFTLGLCMICGVLNAQDIHFTLYEMSPLTINPALTGSYEGSFRVGGIFRDQWSVPLSNSYTTPSVYIDAPLFNGFRKKKGDWIGGGFVFYNDVAGLGDLTRTGYYLSGSYHFALDKKSSKILSIGVQGGQVALKLDGANDGFNYQDEYNTDINDWTNPTADPISSLTLNGQDSGRPQWDINAGVKFKTYLDKAREEFFEIGGSVLHINRLRLRLGDQGQSNTVGERLPITFNTHAVYHKNLSKSMFIEPSAYFISRGSAYEALAHVWSGFKLNNDKVIRAGLGYRYGDAVQVLLGMDIKDLKVAMSYDINTSDVVSWRGGFEIAANYIFKIYKQPTVDQKVLCPQL